MTIKLIYHTLSNTADDVSPFDRAIFQVSNGEEVCIACPYLGLEYLQRIITWSTSWRLLTDIEEWLAIHNNAARHTIHQFMVEHQDKIRHARDLHAKIIVSSQSALVGSANFTEKGIKQRLEMSVLFEQDPQVEEIRTWFRTVWEDSSPINTEEILSYITAMQPRSSIAEKPMQRLPSRIPPIQSRLQPIMTHTHSDAQALFDQPATMDLIQRIQYAPTRTWIDTYFDLMKILIEATGLTNNDPRLVTSIPKSNYFLPFSINNRYVLAPYKHKGTIVIGIICGPEFESAPEVQAKAAYHGRFDPLFRSEAPSEVPFFVRFHDAETILRSPEIRESWIKATLHEVQRAESSPYRRYHQPVVYEAAVNLAYRTMILDAAFPPKPVL